MKLITAVLCLSLLAPAALTQNLATKISGISDAPVTSPTVFAPNIISTGDYEAAEEFAPDGKTLYYLKLTPDFNFWTLVLSRLKNGRWTLPQVAPFSGKYSDGDPFITADGKRFFFISQRPLPGATSREPQKLDIWTMDKTAAGEWGEPRPVGAPVNSDSSEYFPTLTDGGTLYFGSRRAGGFGGCDLYRSKFINGKFREPENLGDAVNTQYDEFEPFIAPDESYMIFMADSRPDGLGGYDLYISYNENGKWTKAENLGAPINTAANELSAKISRDGKYFFWTSSRSAIDQPKENPWTIDALTNAARGPQNGLGDIYYIDAAQLKLRK